MTLTPEVLDAQIELAVSEDDETATIPVDASVVAEHAAELDHLVERLSGLGQLSLFHCRRAAFAILGEDVADSCLWRILRDMYAPQDNMVPVQSRLNLLDGGRGDGYEPRA